MRLEHVVVSIIIFLVILLATILILGKAVPTFKTGIDSMLNLVFPNR
ncbi:MAG: hypothetical protein HYW26_03140 [Candidatus Aenigmarchaeota archaeon]|nr:hypothetical protein [Candidatus Aenigmarchaeota archaeon]